MRDENQLHAAVVELVALDDAEIKYSTVQNWYPGDKNGKGGIYNFVTKRGDCRGRTRRSRGRRSRPARRSPGNIRAASCAATARRGEFYSIAVSNGYQQVDSGTKMIHLGKNTSSRIISKGIAAGHSQNTYRGLVSAHRKATERAQLHQLRFAADRRQVRRAHRALYRGEELLAHFEHEATTSKISDDQLFYCQQRGMSDGGGDGADRQRLRRDVMQQLPMEFAVETQKLIGISLEGSVG